MEIRRAVTAADRLAALEVGHAATSPSQPLELYQARRLKIGMRHRGAWWLLEDGGRAVSSLMCYPLRFATHGGEAPGYGLGAVATRPDARRRGFAAALCRRAIEEAEAGGRSLGLLFSAIPPAYYERLGFAASPAWDHVATDAARLAASGRQAELAALDPRRDVATLVACYRRAHAGLHLYRDDDGWRAGLGHHGSDVFLGLGTPLRGYVRLNLDDLEGVELVELMVAPEARASVLRRVAALATGMGRGVVEGWFEPVPELAPYFEDRGRSATLPMLRGAEEVRDARFWASDYF